MKIFKIISASISVFVATMLFSTAALAQSTVLVVDQARVLRDSDVGKHIQRQVISIGKQMGTEIKSQTSPLVSERDKLVAQLKGMDIAALKTRPDLEQKAVKLQEDFEKSKLEQAYKQKELQITEQKAVAKVNAKIAEILKAIVNERKADILLDRTLVIYSGEAVDVTETVLTRLNSQMRTVSVIRERITRKPLPQRKK